MDSKRITTIAGSVVGIGAVAAALAVELRKPRKKRTWHGQLAGFVPYDFRRPTVTRARSRWWNPHDGRLLTPKTYGVGWDVNLARLVRR